MDFKKNMKEKLGHFIQITPSALLNSKNGTFRLDKISPQTFVQSASGKKQKIVQKDFAMDEDIYELTLKNGHSIFLGGKTLVETVEGTKAIKDLTNEDFLKHKISGIIADEKRGNKEIHWEDNLKTNANPIKVPKEMSPDFALWLGIVCSKGKILKTGLVGINSRNPKILTHFAQLTHKLFKLAPEIAVDKNTGMPIAYIISKNISKFLFEFIGNINRLRKVPKQIMEGSSQEQMEFIRGISLDSYVEDNRIYLYGGVSKKIANFIANSMRNFGYHVTLRQKISGSGSLCYSVKLVGKWEESMEFVLLEESKREKAKIPLYNFMTKVEETFLENKVSTSHKNYSAIRNLRQRKPKTCLAFIPFNLKVDFPKEFYYVQVKNCRKLSKDKNKPLFKVQTFNSEGIVVDGLILLGYV